jgi:periplasmic copper chaperone A
MRRRSFLFLPIAATSARAHSYAAGAIKIGHAWALPTTLSEGQVFMPLLNTAKEPDALVAARGDICKVIELRPTNRYDDIPQTEFQLAPGKPFPMRPTSKHLRLIGLTKPLAIGDRFTLVLDFFNAGEIEVEVYVEQTPGD